MQIIVASSNIFRRELSVFVLTEAGYHLAEARDGAALLALVGEASPEILIVDVLLARGDPAELQRRIRELSRAPILWLTHNAADAAALPNTHQDDRLLWPYSPDDLLRRIARLIAPSAAPADLLSLPLCQRYAGDCI